MERLKKKELLFLILIIALSIFFRFFLLDQADMVGDESTYSFRAFGYLDSFVSSGQVTSIDWFDIPPWWSKLSFHDHPPLSFILNKIFLNLFGPTPFAARFLVALAGVFSTFLIYLISQKWYGENVGLLAALFFAINNFTVWIGRVGLQESLLIALVLTSLYFFILAQEKKTLLYFSALFLGLAFLTKYTAIFVLPFYLVSIFVKNKDWLKHKEFYLSLLLFLVVISPVLIYNVLLYKTFGHFDLQLSYLFNLNQVAGWDKLPGKSDLALGQGLIDLPKNLATLTSPAFIIILVLALVTFGLLIKIAPYRLSRLVVFLNPEIDPQGSGYQINQALLAIGSGGFWGLGLGQSRQKYNYLPEVVGDSIFAVIAEELGFIGVIALITLFVLLAFLGFKIAKSARDDFGRLAACGITIWLVFQAFVNMGAMVGLLPLTGIPLPFISLGGTALTVSLASIGILINIARQSR